MLNLMERSTHCCECVPQSLANKFGNNQFGIEPTSAVRAPAARVSAGAREPAAAAYIAQLISPFSRKCQNAPPDKLSFRWVSPWVYG